MAHDQYEMNSTTREGHPENTDMEDAATLAPISPKRSNAKIVKMLPGTAWPFIVVAFYSALAIVAWTFVAILSKRSMRGKKSYTETIHSYTRDNEERFFDDNENYIKAAQVLRSIVTLLTIPVTTTICSMAAVAYMQSGWGRNLTLGKTMALADHKWIELRRPLSFIGAGSFPLYLAFALTIIGR